MPMNSPVGAVETTLAAGWFWDKFGKDIVKSAAGVARERWARYKWSDHEIKYKTRMLECYSTTKLLGNPKEIRLDQIYTDVYVLDKQAAMRRLALEELEDRGVGEDGIESLGDRVDLLPLFRESKRLYLLGKPGAGKSTFLKNVVLKCCSGEIDKTPIFVSLKQWSDSGLDLLPYIEKEFDVCAFPEAGQFIRHLLTSGEAVILFDGLDEVNQEGTRRQGMIDRLTDFARKYTRAQIVVTCRIAATDYSFDKFKYLEIADFTADQQRIFVSKWYADDSSRRQAFLKGWESEENRGLRDLARTPLLLALLCLAFDETLVFPKRRVELYQEALTALLRKWDSSRGVARDNVYKSLSHVRKEQLLCRIASSTFLAKQIFFRRQVLSKHVQQFLCELPKGEESGHDSADAESVINAIEAQHGLLVERAHGIYSFSHLTFQEYFTAEYLVERGKEEVARQAHDHAIDDQWREVLLLVASLMDDASPLLDALLNKMNNFVRDDPKILALIEASTRASNGRAQGAIATGKTVHAGKEVHEDEREQTKIHSELLDAALTLAAQLHFVEVDPAVVRRVRALASIVRKSQALQRIGFFDSRQSARALIKYLKVAAFLLECLQLSVVRARAAYSDALLRPSEQLATY